MYKGTSIRISIDFSANFSDQEKFKIYFQNIERNILLFINNILPFKTNEEINCSQIYENGWS
jgi:hypothetical protein